MVTKVEKWKNAPTLKISTQTYKLETFITSIGHVQDQYEIGWGANDVVLATVQWNHFLSRVDYRQDELGSNVAMPPSCECERLKKLSMRCFPKVK